MNKPRWTPGPWRLGEDACGDNLTIWGKYPNVCITSVFDDRMGDDAPPMKEAVANARLIVAAPDLARAAQLQEDAEDAHANCSECEGEGVPELCPRCFPLFDDARIARRAALARARGDE